MSKKNLYKKPTIEIINLESSNDIITASCPGDDHCWSEQCGCFPACPEFPHSEEF